MKKDLLTITDLSREEILALIDKGLQMDEGVLFDVRQGAGILGL